MCDFLDSLVISDEPSQKNELLEHCNELILNHYFTGKCDNLNRASLNNQLLSQVDLMLLLINDLDPQLIDEFLIKY